MENADLITEHDARRMLQEIMTEQQVLKFEQLNDIDFAYQVEGIGRFRGNVFLQNRGMGAVFRIIPQYIVPLEELHLPRAVHEFTRLNRGLVLITGPTGNGKSTTLASMIDHINRHRKTHIITIEDPLEFIHTNKKSLINQREIGPHSSSFCQCFEICFPRRSGCHPDRRDA